MSVRDSSQVFEARRSAVHLAQSLGWDDTMTGQVAIAANEIATNLVKHAEGGELHIRLCDHDSVTGLELIALDRGPGLANPGAALRDGFSTSGTSGTGLGAIRRLSAEFDIHSQIGRGTVLVARFFSDREKTVEFGPVLRSGVIQVPVRNETVCGDSWGIRRQGSKFVVLLADGLGHGSGAAEASREAVAVLQRATDLNPIAVLDLVHQALRSTRGAAVAVASIDATAGEVLFSGVGNISAVIANGKSTQQLVSHYGTAGQVVRKLANFTYPWSASSLLIMHSDGLNTAWRLDATPGLTEKHPALISTVLYRDASRGNDDACVIAVSSKWEPEA